MILNNGNCQDFIAKCLFGERWNEMKQFVIPRKGNFINPQYLTPTNTYAIYYITEKVKKLVNSSLNTYGRDVAKTTHCATLRSNIDIQFIGVNAEEWANSTLFWDERIDVQKVFSEYRCQLLLGDSASRSIITVPFQQEGYNGEMSYLASIGFLQSVTVEEVVQYCSMCVWLKGNLVVN